MAAARKVNARDARVQLAAADNTGASVLAGLYVYDPNPTASYDPAAESVVYISVTPLAAFSHTANSFKLTVQQRDVLAATKGSGLVIWDGTATDGVAFVSLNANAVCPIALAQGDSLSFTYTKQAGGSASIPAAVVNLTTQLTGA